MKFLILASILILGSFIIQESFGEFPLGLTTDKSAYQDNEEIEVTITNNRDSDAILNLWLTDISFEKTRGLYGNKEPMTNTGVEFDITNCIDSLEHRKIQKFSSVQIFLKLDECVDKDVSVIGNWRLFSKTTENDSITSSSVSQEITIREAKNYYSSDYSEEGTYKVVLKHGEVLIPYKITGGKLTEMSIPHNFRLNAVVDTLGGNVTLDIPRELLFLSWWNGTSTIKQEVNFQKKINESFEELAGIGIRFEGDSKYSERYFPQGIDSDVEILEKVNRINLSLPPLTNEISLWVGSGIPEVYNVFPKIDSEYFTLYPPLKQFENEANNIICREGLEKTSKKNDLLYCIKPENKIKLSERGWIKSEDIRTQKIFLDEIKNSYKSNEAITFALTFKSGMKCDPAEIEIFNGITKDTLFGEIEPVYDTRYLLADKKIKIPKEDAQPITIQKDGFYMIKVKTKDFVLQERFYVKGVDAIEEFSPAKKISNVTGISLYPSIAANDKNIFVVWASRVVENFEIFLSKSNDGGEIFSTPQNISNTLGFSYMPSIAVDGKNIFVVWYDESSGNNEIFFSKSNDDGKTFSMPQNLSNNGGDSNSPAIAVNGRNILVVWEDNSLDNYEILFAKSTNGGETFSSPQNISNNVGDSESPSIVIKRSDILVTWHDNSLDNYEILLSKSTDGGETFSTPQNISNKKSDSRLSVIATDGTNLLVTWFEKSSGNYNILFSKSADGGTTFSTPQNISHKIGRSNSPTIMTDGTSILVTWAGDYTQNYEIIFTKSTDDGEIFSTPQNISTNVGTSEAPSMIMIDKEIFVVWHDTSIDGYGILFSKSKIVDMQNFKN